MSDRLSVHSSSHPAADSLIRTFNHRDSRAFGQIYDYFYELLFYYTSKLYADTDADYRDVIHDIFLKLWQSPKDDFESLEEIKAYLLLSIKNARRTLSSHMKHVQHYSDACQDDPRRFKIDVLESEILSAFHNILGILPAESAEILTLFFDGWNAEEIAGKLGKTKQTIYNKKAQAIAELKRKVSKDILMLLLPFL